MLGIFLRFANGRFLVLGTLVAAMAWFAAGQQPEEAVWLQVVAVAMTGLVLVQVARRLPVILRANRARNDGQTAAASVVAIEEMRNANGSFRTLRTRVRFRFQHDGQPREGSSIWGSPHRTGLLAPGAKIDVVFLPESPENAFWIEDLGGARSRRTRQADYEALFGDPGDREPR